MQSELQFFPYIQNRRIMQWGGLADEFDEWERRHGVTLELSWRSRRPYDDTVAPKTKASSIDLNVFMKSGETISDECARALEKYAIPTNQPG